MKGEEGGTGRTRLCSKMGFLALLWVHLSDLDALKRSVGVDAHLRAFATIGARVQHLVGDITGRNGNLPVKRI
jgi:hypothetical protein